MCTSSQFWIISASFALIRHRKLYRINADGLSVCAVTFQLIIVVTRQKLAPQFYGRGVSRHNNHGGRFVAAFARQSSPCSHLKQRHCETNIHHYQLPTFLLRVLTAAWCLLVSVQIGFPKTRRNGRRNSNQQRIVLAVDRRSSAKPSIFTRGRSAIYHKTWLISYYRQIGDLPLNPIFLLDVDRRYAIDEYIFFTGEGAAPPPQTPPPHPTTSLL